MKNSLQWYQHRYLHYLICLIAGSVMVLAFAPFHWYEFAVIAPLPLLCFWAQADKRRAFFLGLCFGLGFFGFGTSWIFISIHVYGQSPAWFAAAFTFLFVLILALFPAFAGYLLALLFPKDSPCKRVLAIPLLWVGMACLRTWLFTGFPWLLTGYSQINSPLSAYIPLLGNYGVTFLVFFSAGALSLLLYRNKHPFFQILLCLVLTILIWLGAGLLPRNWTQPTLSVPISVALIQGNIPQELKWRPQAIANNIDTYWRLSKPYLSKQIIVWPENSIPILKQYSSSILDEFATAINKHHSALITGIPIGDQKIENRYYNGMIVIGNGHGEYYKRHLVPFGEYVPFARQLRGLIKFFNLPMSAFSSGSWHQPLFAANGILIAPQICYEIAYPDLIRSELPMAQLIVTISDDSWFGRSMASAQHLQIAQFRSLQTGRYQLFSSNSGPSAIINSHGKIIQISLPYQKAVVTGTIVPMKGYTPWVSYGNIPIMGSLLLLLLLLLLIQHIQKIQQDKKIDDERIASESRRTFKSRS